MQSYDKEALKLKERGEAWKTMSATSAFSSQQPNLSHDRDIRHITYGAAALSSDGKAQLGDAGWCVDHCSLEAARTAPRDIL